MKRLILSSLLLLLFSMAYTSQAQVRYGVRMGINFSSLPTKIEADGVKTKVDDMKGLTRFYAGGVVDVPFSWRWHMQTGIDFSWQGGKIGEDKLRNTQIQIPALAKMYVIEGMPIMAGIYGSYSTSIKTEIDGQKYTMTDYYNEWDFGMQAGVAYEFPFGMFVEFRYSRGFLNVAKDVYDDYSLKMHNQCFQAGIGFRI